jgi:hypothetical protein
MTLMSGRSQSVTKAVPGTLSEVHRSAHWGAPALAIGTTVATTMPRHAGRTSSAGIAAHLVCPGGDRVGAYERGCAQ